MNIAIWILGWLLGLYVLGGLDKNYDNGISFSIWTAFWVLICWRFIH